MSSIRLAMAGMVLALSGCVYSSSPTEPQGFSSSHFRYQMQANERTAAARRQQAFAAMEQQPPQQYPPMMPASN